MKKYIRIWKGNPFKTMRKLRGIFIPLEMSLKIGKWNHIAILPVSKDVLGKVIDIFISDVIWKDKYDTPRYEYPPMITITFFRTFCIHICWNKFPKHLKGVNLDDYWEQALWYLYYSNTISQGLGSYPNIKLAKKGWPWQDMKGNSTWNDIYLTNKAKNKVNEN